MSNPTTPSPTLGDHVRARTVGPLPRTDLEGYVTRGGTYMLATAAHWTDSGVPRDLLAIVPTTGGVGKLAWSVVQLWPFVNPSTVTELQADLDEHGGPR